MSDATFPTDATALTPQWLNELFELRGLSGRVNQIRSATIGTGQVGENVRFQLRYQSGDGPTSLVGKFRSADPISRQTGVTLNNYLREVRFYQELQPTLEVHTPTVWFTDIDEFDDHAFLLLMEDLTPGEQGNQLTGCDTESAALGIDELARLHGPRWNDSTLHQYSWLSAPDETSNNQVVQLWQSVWPGFVQRYQHLLTKQELSLAEALGNNFTHWKKAPMGPTTVTHGDFRLDNMMFGGPYPLAIVDWQSPAIGTGAADLAYFLGTSLTPELRRQNEQQLVAQYYAALGKYDIKDYSQEQCWHDYRYHSFAGLIMAVIASMIVGQTERGDEMFMVMAKRSVAAALDLEALQLIVQ